MLGSQDLMAYLDKYEHKMDPDFYGNMLGKQKQAW